MKTYLQSLFAFMSQEKNWHQSVMLMVFYSLSFILIGIVIAWIVDKLIGIKKPRPESFEDLSNFTWKNGRFEKMKSVK